MSTPIKSLKKTKNKSKRQSVLERRIKELEKENRLLKEKSFGTIQGDTVSVPKELKPVFDIAQKTVGDYFKKLKTDPTQGTIDIDDQRYVLVRASALSYDFLTTIKNLYADRGEKNAFLIGKNFLFDIAHVIGVNDAKNFHNKMGLTDPIAKLSAGPVHFAYSGWAFVDILPESAPSPDENYFLIYNHPFSFEADSWIKERKKSEFPVCIMNAGYSSGWCEESFGISLTSVEITCKAKGDDKCTFIMAPPTMIGKHIKKYMKKIPAGVKKKMVYDIPTFFERKKVEETLRASEEKYRDLFENATDLIQSLNPNGKILYVNNAWKKTLGYTSRDLNGKTIFDFIHPDDFKRCKTLFKKVMVGKQFEGFEISFITKKGKKVIAEGNTSCKFINGKPVSTRGIFHNVTKSREIERAIKESEEKYRAIYDHANIGISRVGLDGKFINVNQQLCKIMGYSEEELYKMKFKDLTHPDDLKKSMKFKNALLKEKHSNSSIEKTYIHKNGSTIYANLTVTLVHDQNGKPDYFVTVTEDITEKKQAKEALLKSEEKFRSLIQNISDMIGILETDGTIRYSSPSMKTILGHDPKDLEGKNVFEFVHPDDLPEVLKQFGLGIENPGSIQNIEFRFRRKDGSWCDLDASGNFLHKNPHIKGIVITSRDVTERKIAERKLKNSLAEKEVLLKEVHHRVKNNLQIISSMLSLQTASIKDKNTINILKDSQNRVKSMAQIYENLYRAEDLAHINFSKYIFDLSKELIHSYQIYDKLVELKHDIEQVFINLDLAISCGLIVNELVSNSLKYAFPGNKKSVLHIGLKREHKLIKLTIGDNGIGLPGDLDFRNSETLGLQLVILLVKQINGTIDINLKGGTKYTITFKALI